MESEFKLNYERLNWEVKELVECTINGNISYGIVQPGQHHEKGIPVLRVNNFRDGYLDISTVLKVAPSIEEKHSKTRLNGGEVLLTLVGSAGQSIVVPKSLSGWNVPRAIAVIKVKKEIGANWINICLQTENTKHFLDSRANTTVQKTLNLADVKKIPILIPPLKEKNFIESCFVSLNNKIELNRQMNQTLEQMAQALFKSWFVDFDPVIDNALDAGNSIPEELQAKAEQRKALGEDRKALPEEIQKLFPSGFEYSDELEKWVPSGWNVDNLKNVTTKLGDGLHGTPSYDENGEYYFINGNNLTDGKITINKNTKRVNHSQFEKYKKELNERTIFVSINGTIGNIGEYNNEKVILGKSVCYFNVKDEIGKYYTKQAIDSDYFFQYLENIATGTTIKNVSLKSMREFPIIIPSKSILGEIEIILSDISSKIIKNHKTIENLTQLRDTLLPKLISGEVRVSMPKK